MLATRIADRRDWKLVTSQFLNSFDGLCTVQRYRMPQQLAMLRERSYACVTEILKPRCRSPTSASGERVNGDGNAHRQQIPVLSCGGHAGSVYRSERSKDEASTMSDASTARCSDLPAALHGAGGDAEFW